MQKPAVKPSKRQPIPEPGHHEIAWPFGRLNYIMFGVALVVIIIGYVLLGQGSITLAPFLLVVGYCVLVPVAILVKDKSAPLPAADETRPLP